MIFCSNMIFVTRCSSLSRAFIIELILEFWIFSRLGIWDNYLGQLRPKCDNFDPKRNHSKWQNQVQSRRNWKMACWIYEGLSNWKGTWIWNIYATHSEWAIRFTVCRKYDIDHLFYLYWKKIIIRKKLQRSEFVEIYNKFFPHGNATKFSQFVFDVFGKVLTIKFLLSYFKKFYFYLFWTWMKTLTVAEQSISTSLYKALEW